MTATGKCNYCENITGFYWNEEWKCSECRGFNINLPKIKGLTKNQKKALRRKVKKNKQR